jgi:MoaA/NifB/PqqE/SkfB family radical SAM enzyme
MSDLEDVGVEARVPVEILRVIPEFWRSWGVESICLAGHNSDPLAYNHAHLVNFIRALYRCDIEAGLVTNGVLLTEDLIPDISRNCKWTGFSVNAGTSETYQAITGTKESSFVRVCDNIAALTEHCRKYRVKHAVGFKYLITDENCTEIYQAVELAKRLGCRHMQIRPCELPEHRSSKINTDMVDEQVVRGLELQVRGQFEIFAMKEKFTVGLRKKQPARCIATPLGSTWKADGDIVICPDRRWSAHQPNMTLGNYIREGLEVIRRKWGGPEHVAMIRQANEKIGECIRCTSLMWHELYENTVENDVMDIRLI